MAVLGCWSLVLVNNKVATVLRKIKLQLKMMSKTGHI